MVYDQNSPSTIVMDLFAIIGLVSLLIGAGKYYCAKKQDFAELGDTVVQEC